MKWAPEELCRRDTDDYSKHRERGAYDSFKSNVLLKLLQETLCIKTSVGKRFKFFRKGFLMEKM